MTVAQSGPLDPLRTYKFRVSVSGTGFTYAGFSKVTGLRREIDVVEYREGDNPGTPRKEPGMIKFPNVVLERGVSVDDDFNAWITQVSNIINAGNFTADGSADFRRNVIIQVLSRAGVVVKEYVLVRAWPVAHEWDDLDASTSEVWLNRLELAHEGLLESTPSSQSIL